MEVDPNWAFPDCNSSLKSPMATKWCTTWWRHQMKTFSALLAFCAENSPVPGEFSAQRPVTRSCDVFFDLNLNKQLSKQSIGWWFETPSGPLRRHRNEAWSSIEGVSYCFSMSYVKLQGHTALKIVEFDPNWAFPDCNSSLKSSMAKKLCSKLEVA